MSNFSFQAGLIVVYSNIYNISIGVFCPTFIIPFTSTTYFIVLNYGSENLFYPHTRTGKQSWKLKFLKKKLMIGFVFSVTTIGCELLKRVWRTFPPINSGPFTDHYLDLVSRPHAQIKLARNFGLFWLTNTDGELLSFCKDSIEDFAIFLWDTPILEIILNHFRQT